VIVAPEQQTMVVVLLRHWVDGDASKSFLSLLDRKTDCMEEQMVVVVLEQQRIVVVANGIESDFPVWWSLWILRRLSRVVRVIYQQLN
jgi:hypothetical protein